MGSESGGRAGGGGGWGGVFFQAEDGIRDLVRSRGLGDVYKRQGYGTLSQQVPISQPNIQDISVGFTPSDSQNQKVAMSRSGHPSAQALTCLLYTSDAADERSSVDLGGRRIIKKKNSIKIDYRLRLTSKRQQKKTN